MLRFRVHALPLQDSKRVPKDTQKKQHTHEAELKGQTTQDKQSQFRSFSQFLADFCRFSHFPSNYSISEVQIFAENPRNPQIFAENCRKPQNLQKPIVPFSLFLIPPKVSFLSFRVCCIFGCFFVSRQPRQGPNPVEMDKSCMSAIAQGSHPCV